MCRCKLLEKSTCPTSNYTLAYLTTQRLIVSQLKPQCMQRFGQYTASCSNSRNMHKTYYRSAQIILLEDACGQVA
jgi:hypothetical protein